MNVHDLDLYTDASGKHGCGAYYKEAYVVFLQVETPINASQKPYLSNGRKFLLSLLQPYDIGTPVESERICFYCDNRSIDYAGMVGKVLKII